MEAILGAWLVLMVLTWFGWFVATGIMVGANSRSAH